MRRGEEPYPAHARDANGPRQGVGGGARAGGGRRRGWPLARRASFGGGLRWGGGAGRTRGGERANAPAPTRHKKPTNPSHGGRRRPPRTARGREGLGGARRGAATARGKERATAGKGTAASRGPPPGHASPGRDHARDSASARATEHPPAGPGKPGRGDRHDGRPPRPRRPLFSFSSPTGHPRAARESSPRGKAAAGLPATDRKASGLLSLSPFVYTWGDGGPRGNGPCEETPSRAHAPGRTRHPGGGD